MASTSKMFPFRNLLLATAVVASCLAVRQSIGGLGVDFPDPSITLDPKTSHWFVFATQGNGKNFQAAKSADLHGEWTLLDDVDLLSAPAKWVNPTQPDIWAPDVQYIHHTDSFVLYYSGLHVGSPHHCVGVATSPNITGPYAPLDGEPLACPLDDGGAVDASGYFNEASNSRWVVYKVDGSSKGPGGPCGNGEPPGFDTPIMLQRVKVSDGITPIGKPHPILHRDPDLDGPLVEAPSLIKHGTGCAAVYVLFYSSHCYNVDEYDVRYATAKSIFGPYARQHALLGKMASTKDMGLVRPGGATSVPGGGALVFHAKCRAGRCMHQMDFEVAEGLVKLLITRKACSNLTQRVRDTECW